MSKRSIYIKKLTMLALAVSMYIISGLYIKINIPPVPFSTLTLFTMLTAMLIGKYLAPLAMLIYIAMGLAGLPIFASGLGGPMYVFQPSFGYLIGFVISSFIVGWLNEYVKDNRKVRYEALLNVTNKWERLKIRVKYSEVLRRFVICILGLIVVYFVGVLYFVLMKQFYFGEGVDMGSVMISFVLIFIPSDTMWCILASVISGKIIRALRLNQQ